MPKCGFCKQEIYVTDFETLKKNLEKTVHRIASLKMFCCPHCDSVIGFKDV